MAIFQRCTIGMEIQSVLFPREQFSVSKAKTWAKRHGFIRIITLGRSGVKAIIACPKRGMESARDYRKDVRDRREVNSAIKDFRNVPRSGRGRERASRIRRAIGR